NYGDMLVSFLIPSAEAPAVPGGAACPLTEDQPAAGAAFNTSIDELLAAEQVDDVEAARAGVENGDYAAMVLIPPDFSARLTPNIGPVPLPSDTDAQPEAVEIYANSGQVIEGTIVRSIVEGFTNQLLTGNIAIGASINTLIQQNPTAALQLARAQDDPQLGGIFGCGFAGELKTVSVDSQPVQAEQQPRSLTTMILVQTGSAQAVFFALFSGQFGVLSIINERRSGTLQRMLATPTPRSIIITGKLFSTVVMIVVQISILLAALTLVASIVEGGLMLIWGSNLLAVAAVVLALALAVAGLGVLLMGLARTPEQVGPVGAILNILMGAVGGAFGFAAVLPVGYLSLIYWGTDAFNKLSLAKAD